MESNDILELRMRDIDRLKIIQQVLDGRLNARQAAAQLNLSRRQVVRIKHRLVRHGNCGIVHRLRGRPSNHRLDPGLIQRAIQKLRQPLYEGFGPTFANEQLREEGLVLSTASLRRVMMTAGLWNPRSPQPQHRSWRPRRDCLGELVQLDGSDHAWFEGRSPRCVLVAYIDDATSRILYAEFVNVEDTLTLLRTTRTYLQRHGRPVAFYVDKDSIYKTNRRTTIEEALRDAYPSTQFTRAMAELGIGVMTADSPQAKGRVERLFHTLQDRLVKELRLASIADTGSANQFLWRTYLPAHHAQFAVPPANTTDAHRPLLTRHRLEEILSVRTERTLANDYTLRFQHQCFQVLPEQPVRIRPKDTVVVETRLDGSTQLRCKDRYLRFIPIAQPPSRPLALSRPVPAPPGPRPRGSWKPAADHPWRRFPACRAPAALRAHTALAGVP